MARKTRGEISLAVRGLWFDRIRIETSDGQIWIEIPVAGISYSTSTAVPKIEALRQMLTEGGRQCFILPDLDLARNSDAFCYSLKLNGSTVFEMLNRGPGAYKLVPFFAIGEKLAVLHATSLRQIESTTFKRQGFVPIREFLRGNLEPELLGTLRSSLECCRDVELLVEQAEDEIDRDEKTLLHGRWSSGAMVSSSSTEIAALSGVDCWFGPAAFDAGYFLGEIIELAADLFAVKQRASYSSLIDAAELFLCGYRSRRVLLNVSILRFIGHRIISHLAANILWRRNERIALPTAAEISQILSIVSVVLKEFESRLDRQKVEFAS